MRPPSAEKHSSILKINEIFRSIQGESTWAGCPCVFVRLTGCNLRCAWCDTSHAFEEGEEMVLDTVVGRVEELGGPLVEITGGEPLMQAATPELAQRLLERGKTVLCETNGSYPIDLLPPEVKTVMDLKCPGSGQEARNDWDNIERLQPHDEVKFVLADRADYEWSRSVLQRYNLEARCHAVLFVPVFGAVPAANLAEWILEDRLPVRLQIQLHKHIWAPDAHGV